MRASIIQLALAAVLAVLAGCAAVPIGATPPHISVAGLRVVEMGVLEQRYALLLRVQNPNDFALPVTGMEFELSLNGHPFANGVSDHAVTIPAYGTQTMRVEVVSSLGRIVQQLDELQHGNGGLRYRISGHVKLAGRDRAIPFDYESELLPGAAPSRSSEPAGGVVTALPLRRDRA
jgi:LEA14-like dessication related protein